VVIKENDFKALVKNLKQKVLEKMNTGHVDSNDVEVIFNEGTYKRIERQMKVFHEPPFTQWLYEYIDSTIGDTFIVETQQQNLKDIGIGILGEEINEYAASLPDLVIRRDGSKEPLMVAVVSLDIPVALCSLKWFQKSFLLLISNIFLFLITNFLQ